MTDALQKGNKPYQVVLTFEFQREFRKLSPDIQNIAKKRLLELEENPRKGDPLKYDLMGFYSLHFHRNKYRIIYTIEENIVKVLALHIGKRTDDFYKNFKEELKRRRKSIIT